MMLLNVEHHPAYLLVSLQEVNITRVEAVATRMSATRDIRGISFASIF